MATDAKKLQPIIVKKIKKAGHAHHGGAWKIAYADFVTAMMAFFLLMWLLGSTAQGDLKGIADYFNSPLKVAMSGGSGSGDSSSIIKGGGRDLSRQTGQVNQASAVTEKKTYNLQAARAEAIRAERAHFEQIKLKIEGALGSNASLAQFSNQIRLDITAEGLRIQIVDEQNRPMFDSGSAQLKPHTRDIMREIGRALADVEHRISMAGHTDAAPFPGGERGYGNWELSADRANAARREMMGGGVDEKKILRVVGLAAAVPFRQSDPFDAANRRISILVMNKRAEEAITNEGPSLTVTGAADVAQGIAVGAAEAAAIPLPVPAIAPPRATQMFLPSSSPR